MSDAALRGPLRDLYEHAKSKFLPEIQLDSIRNLDGEALYARLLSVQNVRTIWQIDKSVNLHDFYYPITLSISGETVVANKLDDIDTETFAVKVRPDETSWALRVIKGVLTKYDQEYSLDNVLIEGTAGQGKSIFLRYLCSNEIQRQNIIPVFIELHKLKHGSLKEILTRELSDLGFSVSDRILDTLFSSGQIVLLLDGFDEIQSAQKSKVVSDLDGIAKKYGSKLRIIVTARPNSEIQDSAYFVRYTIEKLTLDEIPEIIRSATKDEEQAKEITAQIVDSNSDIINLVNTPLMLALLVMICKSGRGVPENFTEFYGSLFESLMRRHDGLKPGFTRDRRCKSLTYSDDLRIFECFCFMSMEAQLRSFDLESAIDVTGAASEFVGIEVNPEDFFRDICDITNLIVEDGNEFVFVHKTVKEYYAARFIAKREGHSEGFYTALMSNKGINAESWRGVIDFARIIDQYRCHKLFLIPEVEKTLTQNGQDPEGAFTELTKKQKHDFVQTIDGKHLGGFKRSFYGLPQPAYIYYSEAVFRSVEKQKYHRYCSHAIVHDLQKLSEYKALVNSEDKHASIGPYVSLLSKYSK